MGIEEAFLQDIADASEDRTARLVYADWLEERGGPGDAAQAELIRLTADDPQTTVWAPDGSPTTATRPEMARALELCRENWAAWAELLRLRLAGSPLSRWLGTSDCRWGYRRGLVAVFEGTEQVLLDAWADLFRLGPIEEVQVNLYHFATVLSLHHFLARPSVRVLRLQARSVRDDCLDQLRKVSDWLRRLDRVELAAPNGPAAHRLVAWLAGNSSLRHVKFKAQLP
jgi:uncharacterized protein (TIGR02996 family)